MAGCRLESRGRAGAEMVAAKVDGQLVFNGRGDLLVQAAELLLWTRLPRSVTSTLRLRLAGSDSGAVGLVHAVFRIPPLISEPTSSIHRQFRAGGCTPGYRRAMTANYGRAKVRIRPGPEFALWLIIIATTMRVEAADRTMPYERTEARTRPVDDLLPCKRRRLSEDTPGFTTPKPSVRSDEHNSDC